MVTIELTYAYFDDDVKDRIDIVRPMFKRVKENVANATNRRVDDLVIRLHKVSEVTSNDIANGRLGTMLDIEDVIGWSPLAIVSDLAICRDKRDDWTRGLAIMRDLYGMSGTLTAGQKRLASNVPLIFVSSLFDRSQPVAETPDLTRKRRSEMIQQAVAAFTHATGAPRITKFLSWTELAQGGPAKDHVMDILTKVGVDFVWASEEATQAESREPVPVGV